MAGEQPRQRQLAAVLKVHGLQDIAERVLGPVHTEPFGGLRDTGRLMAQRLQQPQHAVLAARTAEQHRADQPFTQFAREIVEHGVARRLDVFQQLLHQRVVMVGELLQHREARFLFAIEIAACELDDFGGLVLAIDEGAFQREIDETLDQLAVPDRDLAQHERHARGRLQRRQRLADAFVGAVDLVEKQEARDLQLFQLAQDDLELRQLLLVGLADHDGRVDRGQRRAHVVGELHRTRTVDEGIGFVHEGGGGRRERDAHLVMAGLGAGIADRSSVVDGAGAGDCARARQYCFEKCGFTALERAHQCDAPWTAGTSDVLSHFAASCVWSSARDWVGKHQMLCLLPDFGKRENVAAVHRLSNLPPSRHCEERQRRSNPDFPGSLR